MPLCRLERIYNVFFLFLKKVKGLITEHNLQNINIMHLFTPSFQLHSVLLGIKNIFSILK